MMKRVFAFVLVMILLLSLAACGKSEEEQAQNEIYEHMKEEAAEDGVDLDALIASEQAAYLYFAFDLNGSTATGTKSDLSAGTYSEWWFNNNMESFNMEEMGVYWN